jgi:hypothetical protein
MTHPESSLAPVRHRYFENDKRVEVLLSLLNINRDEVAFWRTRNWTALQSSAVAMAALTSVSPLKDASMSRAKDYSLAVMICGIAALHHLYQHRNSRTNAGLRRDRERILEALGMHTAGVFLPEALLPTRKRVSAWGSWVFIFIGWGLAICILAAVAIRACGKWA